MISAQFLLGSVFLGESNKDMLKIKILKFDISEYAFKGRVAFIAYNMVHSKLQHTKNGVIVQNLLVFTDILLHCNLKVPPNLNDI